MSSYVTNSNIGGIDCTDNRVHKKGRIALDSITEKFSAFDFFNLIIGGVVFWIGLGICNYSQAVSLCSSIAKLVGNSNFFLFITIVIFIACSLVAGTVINELAYWFFDIKMQYEKKLIETCLNNNKLIKHNVRLKIIRDKANDYFHENKKEDDIFTEDQCFTFFTHCVYYLHAHGQDKKTEKLRETEGLSELLTLVFAFIPVSSIIIHILLGTTYLALKPTLLIYMLFAIFFCAFLKRSIRAIENRIKMVLAVYDACVDINDCENSISTYFYL